jgi:hypothetical protein
MNIIRRARAKYLDASRWLFRLVHIIRSGGGRLPIRAAFALRKPVAILESLAPPGVLFPLGPSITRMQRRRREGNFISID